MPRYNRRLIIGEAGYNEAPLDVATYEDVGLVESCTPYRYSIYRHLAAKTVHTGGGTILNPEGCRVQLALSCFLEAKSKNLLG